MLFNKNDDGVYERTLYKTKPNMILGCKKAIYGVILLIIVLSVSPIVIQFIGEMQVYLISYVQVSLTRYAAIAFFVVILFIIIYIIWQLVGWYATEYELTDSRIIIKSGVLNSKKNYMPYAKVQDINTSQSILARLFNVGSVSVYSAYDSNQMNLKNISNPSKVENIIFERMVSPSRSVDPLSRRSIRNNNSDAGNDSYSEFDDYYDEFEPITPITHERDNYQRRKYDYYPEERIVEREQDINRYDYEPYDDVDYNVDRAMNNFSSSHQKDISPNRFSNDAYYNGGRGDYSYSDDNYYDDREPEIYYNDPDSEDIKSYNDDVDDTSETVIRRHFDKFKK